MSLDSPMEQELKEPPQESAPLEQEVSNEQAIARTGRRNPPARNTSRFWFERFLAVIQRQNPAVIDASFLSQIAPSNEGKLLAQLKFLRVIDEQGKPTPLLPLLNLVGEEQRKGFQQIAKQSYSELLSEVKIEKAVADDLVNFFIRKYSFTRDKSLNASKFFLYLADKGALPVSQELVTFYSERSNVSNGNSGQPSISSGPSATQRITREARAPSLLLPQRQKRDFKERGSKEPKPVIQATIEIKLDKDTPREYWDRVLALLGEDKNQETREEELGEQVSQVGETDTEKLN